MFKCPKCEYTSENPGNCPADNEVLVEATEQETEIIPPIANEPAPTEESKPDEG